MEMAYLAYLDAHFVERGRTLQDTSTSFAFPAALPKVNNILKDVSHGSIRLRVIINTISINLRRLGRPSMTIISLIFVK